MTKYIDRRSLPDWGSTLSAGNALLTLEEAQFVASILAADRLQTLEQQMARVEVLLQQYFQSRYLDESSPPAE